jgi:hypothetical protein
VPIDREQARQCLKEFDFRRLFLDQLGWDKHASELEKVLDGRAYRFQAVSEKRGVVVLVSDSIPEYSARVRLDRLIAKDHFEHLIIFADQARGRQVWQWMRRESGKPNAIRAYSYSVGQSGELLLQKLEHLVVTLDEEDQTGLADILGRVRAGFDVEKVTKKFYERFKEEHDRFLKFVVGIPDEQMEAWYASVMINRLMFLYFIQAKSFLNGDLDYLRNKLKESRDRKKDGYYRDFLCPLFFEGFARKKEERSVAVNKLLGAIPYLNGGLFQRHQIEELHGKKIQITDTAFERLFGFFREYTWHLDERENRNDREINPDVLGYIFEKYINQKQMGAYYTKEDITGYISQNTIIPFVLDAARKNCTVAFDKGAAVWRLLQDDPDRYIYAAVRHGASLELPADIAAGLSSVKKRSGWNRTAPPEYALPTEIWREVVERRRRYQEVRGKLARGEVSELNDLITLNLDVRQFAEDVIQLSEGPELLRALYKVISKVSVLDPTCGSGAFLFAALNILKPVYETCLQRMQMFVDELDASPAHHPKKFDDFRQVLEESKQHPKQDYFILKSIIVNNLYGVDIMEEAVEICKLRLFLKLVAQVDSQDRVEPLPDIDFNIRAGNTLVGYTRITEIGSGQGNLLLAEQKKAVEDKAKTLDSALELFRRQQTSLNGIVTIEDKLALRGRFAELEDELDDFLAAEYGLKQSGVAAWKQTHKPFHWLVDFHRIMAGGGFDVIIGNPPYIELKEVDTFGIRNYKCFSAGNLYAVMLERCAALAPNTGRLGFIVPVSSISTDRYEPLQRLLAKRSLLVYSSYDDRPSRLFDGLEHIRLTIHLFCNAEVADGTHYSSRYNKWAAPFRSVLFPTLGLQRAMPALVPGTLPKLCSPLEVSIINKLRAENYQLGLACNRHSEHAIFYSRKVGYFLQVLDFEPRVLDGKGRKRPPSEFKALYFDSSCAANAALCTLNSTLFYWFVTVFSDCRHVNKREVEAFPFKVDRAIKGKLGQELSRLATKLMKDLQSHSENREMTFAHDALTVQCIIPRFSKSIIDEIDAALANYFGFTDEEVDFIINYDIKYRLGADTDAE